MANEKRLIDANALKKELAEENPYVYLGSFGYCACSPKTDAELVFKRAEVLFQIELAPTVDAVEVVHGCWIEGGKTMVDDVKGCVLHCSKCHDYCYNFEPNQRHNYCPNCGAKMDGDWNG